MVDKSNIHSGLVRIGYIESELDVVISCTNNTDLKEFIDTIEIVQHQTPLRISMRRRPSSPGPNPFSIACRQESASGSSTVSIILLQDCMTIFRFLEVSIQTIDVYRPPDPVDNYEQRVIDFVPAVV